MGLVVSGWCMGWIGLLVVYVWDGLGDEWLVWVGLGDQYLVCGMDWVMDAIGGTAFCLIFDLGWADCV